MMERAISRKGWWMSVMWLGFALAPVFWLALLGAGSALRGEKVPFGEMLCLILSPILLLCTWVAVTAVMRLRRNRLQTASSR